jgi:hypothetical protein
MGSDRQSVWQLYMLKVSQPAVESIGNFMQPRQEGSERFAQQMIP